MIIFEYRHGLFSGSKGHVKSAFQDCEAYKSQAAIDKERVKGLLSLMKSFRKFNPASIQKRSSPPNFETHFYGAEPW